MLRFIILPILSISFLFFGCSSGSFTSLDSIKSELGVQSLPVQSDYPDDDGIILTEIHDVDLTFDSDWTLSTTEDITVVKKLFKNIENYANVEIHLNWGEKLESIDARTIKPDGTPVMLKRSDFHEIKGAGNDYIFYSDKRIIKFTFPAIEKDCIIHYTFRIRKNYPFIFDEWRIQNILPVMKNEFRLTVPVILLLDKKQGGAGWTWRYKNYNISLNPPVQFSNINPAGMVKSKKETFSWIERDIPPLKFENQMPPYRNVLRYVRFSPNVWTKWDDVSEWYYNNFFKSQLKISKNLSALSASLTEGIETELEKISSLTKYVQSIRYVAIELGEGGLIPSIPDEVLERKYGDCKDKSLLLLALLKNIGVKAEPVLALTSVFGEVDVNFPSWYFNHMILKITTQDGQSYWVDPTANFCALGQLPWQCEGINVLVIDENGKGKIETTPQKKAEENLIFVESEFNLESNNDASGTVRITFSGINALIYRNYLNDMTDEERKNLCKSFLSSDFKSIEIINSSTVEEANFDKPLTIDFNFYISEATTAQGDLIFLNSDPFKELINLDWALMETRKHMVVLKFPVQVEKRIIFDVSKSKLNVRNYPTNTRVIEKGLNFKREISLDDENVFKSYSSFSISNKNIKSNDYHTIKKSIDGIITKLKEKIILHK